MCYSTLELKKKNNKKIPTTECVEKKTWFYFLTDMFVHFLYVFTCILSCIYEIFERMLFGEKYNVSFSTVFQNTVNMCYSITFESSPAFGLSPLSRALLV